MWNIPGLLASLLCFLYFKDQVSYCRAMSMRMQSGRMTFRFCSQVAKRKWMSLERKNTFSRAVINGSLEKIIWRKENHCPWIKQTFANTASRGNFEIMKVLKENGCPWDEYTFRCSKHVGGLRILRWLKQKSCPWDLSIFSTAAFLGNLEILIWIKEN